VCKGVTDLVKIGKSAGVYRAACAAARREDSDTAAAELLRAEIRDDRRGVARALRWLGTNRDEYVCDRAYRVLHAIATNKPVEPIRPAVAAVFEREAELGRAPLARAFEILVELEPRLRDLQSMEDENVWGKRLTELLGPNALGDDALVRSQLALSVASHYLTFGSDGRASKDITYFAAPVKVVTRSGSTIRR
jgi:hypothetical protein